MIKCNLAVLLAERNLKISELSKRTGISRTTLTALTQNQSKGIQFDTFDTICNFLNVKPNDLFIQEKFDYDFEVLEITEEFNPDGSASYTATVHSEINYNNRVANYAFNCYAHYWYSNNTVPQTVTGLSFNTSFPQEIKEILNSIPVTFRISFEQELLECLKAEFIVKHNLDDQSINFEISNLYF